MQLKMNTVAANYPKEKDKSLTKRMEALWCRSRWKYMRDLLSHQCLPLPACGAVKALSKSSLWPSEHNLPASSPDIILISLCSTA